MWCRSTTCQRYFIQFSTTTNVNREYSDYASKPWWRHQMETFSALLAICEGNPSVTGGFPPSQRPATRSFDVLFDVRLNKRLSKQSICQWFETPWRLLWRHCGDNIFRTIKLTTTAEHLQQYVFAMVPRQMMRKRHSTWQAIQFDAESVMVCSHM